ncbi:SH3 domain-containing protein [Deinococcus sonorensis]|uniref:SH3 domain-containing protein n=2 Tax=Deinococcus sonorensis TaxID=309891 RepID=A0AAU7U8S9_9DEIO
MTDTVSPLDRRIHAHHPERRTADAALIPQLEGEWTALSPTPAWADDLLSLRASPDETAAQVSEALPGERMELLEVLPGGWSWVRTTHDSYLGYARSSGLSTTPPTLSVPVTVLRGHVYAAPRIQAQVLGRLGYGAVLSVQQPEPEQHGAYRWWRVRYGGTDGYVRTSVTEPQQTPGADLLHKFLGVPYLWGGRSAWGIDCSGLMQLASGYPLPRDADQQQAYLSPVDTPQAGDLVFFPGHVGYMLDERRVLHANATHMAVSIETLGEGEYGRQLADSVSGYGRMTPELWAAQLEQA